LTIAINWVTYCVVNTGETNDIQALICLGRNGHTFVSCRTVSHSADPERMVGELCEVMHVTFAGNFSRATRVLLSRDWLVLDASTIGLYPTLTTPARHPLVAGVGVARQGSQDRHETRRDLSEVASTSWAYVLTTGHVRLQVLDHSGLRWRPMLSYTVRECGLIGRARARARVR
jgi:hypothetical protein